MGGRWLFLLGLGLVAAAVVASGGIWTVIRPASKCDIIYDACLVQAKEDQDQCLLRCEQLWLGTLGTCRAGCGETYGKAVDGCSCPAGTECNLDVQQPGQPTQCCPLGQFLCAGVCRPDCTQSQHLDPASCSCPCLPRRCRENRVQDPTSCECVCAPTTCPPPKMLDPDTCACLCPDGQTDCEGTCLSLTHRDNCGACGKTCGADEDCCDSSCQRIDVKARCGSCDTPCNGVNVDCCAGPAPDSPVVCALLDRDGANCGACGHACAPGQCCFDYQCLTPNTLQHCGGCWVTCPPTADACCSGECVQRPTDRLNCGQCGHRCAPNQYCTGGTCSTCPAGTEACDDGCFDVTSSASHCGGCSACAAGQLCCGGHCRPPQAGFGCCGGAWVDLGSTAQHCGSCGTVCPAGQLCCNGTCKTSCTTASPCGAGGQPGQVCCGTTWRTPQAGWGCCAGAWVDLTSDESNCQGCGRACASGEVCHAGQCGTACAAGRFCAEPNVSCPIINLPYEETTCCPVGWSSCEAALDISVYGRQCCPQNWACCETETSTGWIPYCGNPDCTGGVESLPRPGTSTTR